MFRSERRFGIVSLALIFAMTLALLFNVFTAKPMDVPAVPTGEQVSETYTTFEKSALDLSSVSKQFIDNELAQQNIESYDGERWVIVELEGASLLSAFKSSARYSEFADYLSSDEAKRMEKSIQKTQQSFLQKLDKRGVNYVYKYSYSTLNNGVALKIDAATYNVIKNMNGVKDVYYSESYAVPQYTTVNNNANVYATGIYQTAELKDIDGESYQGEGMVVAILDTGLDYTHPAFNSQTEEDLKDARWQKSDIEAILRGINADGGDRFYAVGGADDLYYSLKVPFTYDYAEDDADVYASYESHGTHVAGIVAGYDPDKKVNPNDANEVFVGVAPKAQLAIMKVFTDDLEAPGLGGANTVDILRALNDCVALGVDVINMSLGTSAGFSDAKSNDFLDNIYQMIEDEGISLVVAASNDYSSGFGGGNGTNLSSNPDSGTVGAPSTYQAALSVASINGQMSKYIRANYSDDQIAFITNSSDQYSNELDFIDMMYEKTQKSKSEPLVFKYVLISGIGASTNYNQSVRNNLESKYCMVPGRGRVEVDGCIALIKRGTNTFAEKVQAAMDAGADACVIYNNVSGVIRMSLGEVENPIPACSISMDAANIILANTPATGMGIFEISPTYEAGPFMSDFSSWGPTPSLQIKPEITAHGGEITSAVGGNAYNILSGTSMASPNMAGAVAILRQYVKSHYTDKNGQPLEGQELEARVNQLLMSTATIAHNEENNPYSPRKQGAGLGDILSAVMTEGYIYVRDSAGNELDKTKLELGDDPTKTGVYTLNFVVKNASKEQQTYSPTAYVMTETMASDNKTVAEKAFMFGSDYADVEYTVDGQKLAGNIVVAAGQEVAVQVKITLKDTAKKYLDDNFVNGMYVEGFVSLDNLKDNDNNAKNGGISLSIPFLAFYGDWNAAPLFDYDVYELAESEKDTGVPEEEKLKASAAATQVVGMYYNDEMLLPLGTYVYNQDENEVQVYPSKDKLAVSMYDEEGERTIYEIYCVWAGLLRSAAYVDIVITNHATGELVYEYQLENVAKSYAGGGSGRGAFIDLAIKPYEWGMKNNESFDVYVKGQLDYKTTERELAQNPNRGDWSFTFTADYEAPQLRGYRVRFVPYTEYGTEKYRIYMDLDIYDNQYVMDVLPAYIAYSRPDQQNAITLLTEYPVPVESGRNTVTTVSFEITDYYEKLVETGDFYVQIEDYAMNGQVYRVALNKTALDMPTTPNTLENPFIQEDGDKLVHPNGRVGTNSDGTGATYDIYQLTIQPNEVYKLNSNELLNKYTWVYEDSSDKNNNANVLAKGAEIFGKATTNGPVSLYLTSGENTYNIRTDQAGKVIPYTEHIYAEIEVTVAGPKLADPRPTGIKFKPIYDGDQNISAANGAVELNPNMTIDLEIEVTPWYCTIDGFKFYTSNRTVADVSDLGGGKGRLVTRARGTTTITAEANITSAYLTAQFDAIVGEPFEVLNYTLYEYYGGPEVVIPDDLNIMYLNEDCFKYNTEITKVVLPSTLTAIPEMAFEGCTNLKEITIPGMCQTINRFAFYGCSSLETIILPNYVDAKRVEQDAAGQLSVGDFAFAGCTNLKYIAREDDGVIDKYAGWERVTTLYNYAFAGCTQLDNVDLSALRVTESGVFAGCTGITNLKLDKNTEIGPYMFDGCTGLRQVTYPVNRIPNGVFRGCNNLKQVSLTTDRLLTLGAEAFKGSGITSITLPSGSYAIGTEAFASCGSLTEVKLSKDTQILFSDSIPVRATALSQDGDWVTSEDVLVSPFANSLQFTSYAFANTVEGSNFYAIKDGVLYDKTDEHFLINVPVGKAGTIPEGVTRIGDMAFAGVNIAGELDLSGVTEVGKYAFAQSGVTKVTLPATMTVIPEGMFLHCTELLSVGLENVQEIGDYAFLQTGKTVTGTARTFTDVDLTNTKKIGAYAFYESKVKNVRNADKVTEVGEFAFAYSKLKAVNMPALEKVGMFAFVGEVIALSGTGVNTNYDQTTGVETVNIGPVKEMGIYAFAQNISLTTVTIAEGATEISDHAFEGFLNDYGLAVSGLRTVNLPSSVKRIGESAFEYHFNLSAINLGNVEYIGNSAFGYSEALRTADLSSATYIGDLAFFASGITAANLSKAEYVGDAAFGNAENLSGTIDLSKAKYVGENAFAYTDIESVILSEDLVDSYVYRWDDLDDKGFVENKQGSTADNWSGLPRERYKEPLGLGAFAECQSLVSITVNGSETEEMTIGGEKVQAQGNGRYFSYQGVLYSKKYDYLPITESEVASYKQRGVEVVYLNARADRPDLEGSGSKGRPYAKVFKGYQLEQFPGDWNEGNAYSVAEGTLSIRSYAFEGAVNITEVTLPNSVVEIGDAAFYNTNIMKYTFNSIEAPTLLSDFDSTLYAQMDGFIKNFNKNFMPARVVQNSPDDYTGFYTDYAAFADAKLQFLLDFWYLHPDMMYDYLHVDLDIRAVVPRNGSGYDAPLWEMFFGDLITLSEEDLPSAQLDNVMATINALPSVETIGAFSGTYEQLEAAGGLMEQISNARQLYNALTDPVQIALSNGINEKLEAAEKALRDVKARLGKPVAIVSVTPTGSYNTSYQTINDAFDPTGLELRVLFDDASEIKVAASALTFSPITAKQETFGDGFVQTVYVVTTTWSYEDGTTYPIEIRVNLRETPSSSGGVEPGGTEQGGSNGGGGGSLSAGAIAGIAIGATAALAIVAAVVIILMKRKRI